MVSKYIFLIISLFTLFCIGIITSYVYADELEDIGKQIAELEQAKKISEDATKPLKIEAGQI